MGGAPIRTPVRLAHKVAYSHIMHRPELLKKLLLGEKGALSIILYY